MEDKSKKPFNDAVDHMHRIEGMQTENADFRKMPKPIRFLGYFFIGFIVLTIVFMIIGEALQ